MILQAHVELSAADVLGRKIQIAGAQRIQVLNQIEYRIHRRQVTVGSEISRAVPDNLAGFEHTREILILHTDGRVGLVVFQQYIVAGLVFLDQIIFQQQCIFFRIHHDVSDVGNLAHEHPRLARLVLFAEIRINPSLQILRLSNVDNRSLLVQVLVNARLLRKVGYNSLQIFTSFAFLFFAFRFSIHTRFVLISSVLASSLCFFASQSSAIYASRFSSSSSSSSSSVAAIATFPSQGAPPVLKTNQPQITFLFTAVSRPLSIIHLPSSSLHFCR